VEAEEDLEVVLGGVVAFGAVDDGFGGAFQVIFWREKG
jgi:hypothetical protein